MTGRHKHDQGDSEFTPVQSVKPKNVYVAPAPLTAEEIRELDKRTKAENEKLKT